MLLINIQAAEVWIGGSWAWLDYIAPGRQSQWTFLRNNAEGFYINNFAMRFTDKLLDLADTSKGRIE